jgi:hypothetical protein
VVSQPFFVGVALIAGDWGLGNGSKQEWICARSPEAVISSRLFSSHGKIFFSHFLIYFTPATDQAFFAMQSLERSN